MTPKPRTASPAPPAAPAWGVPAALLGRLAAGSVLAFAGAMKAAAPSEEFALVIEGYNLVSADAAMSLAALLPWVEMLAGFALLTGYFTRAAAAACGALLLSFVAALTSTFVRGIEIANCGCFGPGFHPGPGQTLLMDLALSALLWPAYLWGEKAPSLDAWALSAPEP